MNSDVYEQRFLANLTQVLGPLSEENARAARGLFRRWLGAIIGDGD